MVGVGVGLGLRLALHYFLALSAFQFGILNPNRRLQCGDRDVLQLVDRFFKDLSDEDVDEMLEEWRTFQVAADRPPFKDVPADGNPPDQSDAWWAHMFNMKGPSGVTTFDKLKKLIHALLILPYDQAPVERVFSMIKKNVRTPLLCHLASRGYAPRGYAPRMSRIVYLLHHLPGGRSTSFTTFQERKTKNLIQKRRQCSLCKRLGGSSVMTGIKDGRYR
ncbi:hypothetical protein LSAT2_015648 [Lamellibrachia satsuma]|nr:hypothetical protein LSAT2_015648 [Lamellibrachia satsuma]